MTTTESEPAEAGRELWDDVTGRFELDAAESAVLLEAARTADMLAVLHEVADRDGPMAGDKLHPAVVELRQQRLALARLISSLRLPEQDEAPTGRPQRRAGSRGFYSVSGGAA